MLTARAEFRTPKASSDLVRLCRHLSHKVEAEWDETSGRVDFGPGQCLMRADGETLTLECRASEPEGLTRVRLIVEDHLVRYAWRESPTISWVVSEAGEG